MHFSFSSLINMTVACFILTGIFYLLLRHNKMLSHFGTSLVLGVTSIVILRFLIPVELPFTKSVYIYSIYPDIYHFFIDDFATINGFPINLCRLLAGIWITGSVLLFCRSIRDYIKAYQFCKSCPPLEQKQILETFTQAYAEMGKNKRFHIAVSDKVNTPLIFGISKSFIITPPIDLSEQDWYFIFKHELTHYYRGHLFYHLLCEVMCCLYWWNPAVYLIRRLMRALLEMDVDTSVTRLLATEDTYAYIDCLTKMATLQIVRKYYNKWLVSFTASRKSYLLKRGHFLFDNLEYKRKRFFAPAFLLGMTTILFLLTSNLVIFEPSRRFEDNIEDFNSKKIWDFSEEGCFLLEEQSHAYSIYIDWKVCMEQVAFPIDDPDIRIYSSLEEAYEKEPTK